jgi:hypothetical protein
MSSETSPYDLGLITQQGPGQPATTLKDNFGGSWSANRHVPTEKSRVRYLVERKFV